MPKKKVQEEIVTHNVDWDLEGIMSDRFGRYSKYIIQERALPDARDGLKPVQRRILYAMDVDGNTAEKPHRKSAKTVGLVIGTYHPHGDTSVYDAMVRMSQDWKINMPLIDMHGNNGSMDDDPPAAMRYTEARLSKVSSLLLNDIDKDTVAMTNNYDDTELEPTVLPASFPLLLVNGATGIASGYATNIAPHNLSEVIDATVYRINHPECSLAELMQYVKGPDFPTGGIAQGRKEIEKIFATGRGKVVLRSRCEIIENRTNNQIVISEIPYEVIKSALVKRIDDIRLNKELDGLSDVRDESGRSGIRIVIDLKKEVDPQTILNYLYKNTDLQINYSYNMIAIENHRPVLMTLSSAIDAFIAFREEVVLNRTRYLLDQKTRRMHILEGIMKAVSVLDEVIALIRASKDKADSKKRLCEAFGFSEEQAEAIVTMRLYRLSNTDITALKEEYAALVKETGELKAILASEDILKSVIVKELRDVQQKNPSPRRTVIEEEVEEIVISKEAMIAREDVYVSLTRDGYLRRYTKKVYAANQETLPACKDGDRILGVRDCETLDTLLVFLDSGEYAYIPVYRLEETRWKDLGTHLSQYVKASGGSKVVSAVIVKKFATNAYLLSVTRNGMIKKSPVADYEVTRSSRTLTGMKLKKGDELLCVLVVYDGEEILLTSKDGYYTRYAADILTPISVSAQGVIAMNVKNDEIADCCVLREKENALLILNQEAQGKRIKLEELEITSRASKGIRLFKQRKKEPYQVRYAFGCRSYDRYTVVDGEKKFLDASEVSLLNKEATFGKSLAYGEDFYLIRTDRDIEEVQLIPLKETPLKENYEVIDLLQKESLD
ncbi:MAG: DNA topoisomerase IV subunit A [Erysipelotrichaceae bacterium]|nr:DNA topoisomerase IV subunit A [Erysipelotrichaceae bacterium]